jgi:hypothetical protein
MTLQMYSEELSRLMMRQSLMTSQAGEFAAALHDYWHKMLLVTENTHKVLE